MCSKFEYKVRQKLETVPVIITLDFETTIFLFF